MFPFCQRPSDTSIHHYIILQHCQLNQLLMLVGAVVILWYHIRCLFDIHFCPFFFLLFIYLFIYLFIFFPHFQIWRQPNNSCWSRYDAGKRNCWTKYRYFWNLSIHYNIICIDLISPWIFEFGVYFVFFWKAGNSS